MQGRLIESGEEEAEEEEGHSIHQGEHTNELKWGQTSCTMATLAAVPSVGCDANLPPSRQARSSPPAPYRKCSDGASVPYTSSGTDEDDYDITSFKRERMFDILLWKYDSAADNESFFESLNLEGGVKDEAAAAAAEEEAQQSVSWNAPPRRKRSMTRKMREQRTASDSFGGGGGDISAMIEKQRERAKKCEWDTEGDEEEGRGRSRNAAEKHEATAAADVAAAVGGGGIAASDKEGHHNEKSSGGGGGGGASNIAAPPEKKKVGRKEEAEDASRRAKWSGTSSGEREGGGRGEGRRGRTP